MISIGKLSQLDGTKYEIIANAIREGKITSEWKTSKEIGLSPQKLMSVLREGYSILEYEPAGYHEYGSPARFKVNHYCIID